MNIDGGRQYRQDELPGEVFNSGNGDVKSFNGRAVRVGVNNNGTRSLSDMGDWGSYSNQKSVTDAANQAQSGFNNLVQSNTKSVNDFLGNYKGDVQNAQSTAYDKFGVNNWVDTVNGLNSRISDLQSNSSNSGGGAGTGMGGFANASQVDSAINSRYLPQLNAAGQNLGTSLNAANQSIDQSLAPDKAYKDLLSTNIQTSMQGLTDTQRNVLEGVLGNLNAGVQLSTTQMSLANSMAETVLNNANQKAIEQLHNQYQKVEPGSYLINTGNPNSKPFYAR